MKTGLLLVDIQNDYFSGGRMELVGMNEASLKTKDLLLLFREKQWPTFHVQHISAGGRSTFFLPNTPGVEIRDSVKPLPEDVVVQKHYPNSFRETSLLDKLNKAEVKRLVICGAMSHLCIDATTRAAADLGFQCVVIHDACATTNLKFAGKMIPAGDVHGSFMAALAWGYAKVLSFDEFKSSIMESDSK
ncbi:MAG: cysteine hydrolase family protein [Pseudomonadota bacterium]